MAEETSPTAMQQLFNSFWTAGCLKTEAIGRCLTQLAAMFERKLTLAVAKGYVAAMDDLSQAEIVTACSRAITERKTFPLPATLRELTGRGSEGDPVEREAADALAYLLQGMRTEHGTRLLTLPGVVLRVEEEWKDGERFLTDVLGDRTPFPLSPRLKDALRILGWGSGTKGIALIATHPAVSAGWNFDDDQFRIQPFRVADDILRRWTEAYRQAGRRESSGEPTSAVVRMQAS
jgi:hypothetical protein